MGISLREAQQSQARDWMEGCRPRAGQEKLGPRDYPSIGLEANNDVSTEEDSLQEKRQRISYDFDALPTILAHILRKY
jgi:hypothetical protein